MALNNHKAKATSRSSSKYALIGVVTISVIAFLCWEQTLLLRAFTGNNNNTNDNGTNGNFRGGRKTITSSHPMEQIQAYLSHVDLTKVPPEGSPPNLPSQPVDIHSSDESQSVQKTNKMRKKHGYGGTNDKAHLGGFTTVDPEGISPSVWRDMMEYFGVKSLLDVACGRGFSTAWFGMQGVDIQCVEGSKDAIDRNILFHLPPDDADGDGTDSNADADANSPEVSNSHHQRHQGPVVVEHDFSLGPWWPAKTVDAVWCVELLEHVGRNYQINYLTAFKKAAIIFASHSNWGGWHHVEVHDDTWWINRFEMFGFKYSDALTNRVRTLAREEQRNKIPFPVNGTKHGTYSAQHVAGRMLVSVCCLFVFCCLL